MQRAAFSVIMHIIVIGFVVFAYYSEAAADYYIYTDSSGKRHITDAPTTPNYKLVMKNGVVMLYGNGEYKSVEAHIKSMSAKYGIESALVKAVIKVESDFDKYAVSRVGAKGLMQLMPDTARLMGVTDVHDPYENIEGGVKYLKFLMARFDDNVALALAAYNAGETVVRRYNAIPPYRETKDFVAKVLRYRKHYRLNVN